MADNLLSALLKRADTGRSRCWQGRIAWEKGNYAEAENSYREATTKPDAQAAAWLGLGVSLLKRGGDATEAVAALRKAVEAAANSADAHMALATALAIAGDKEGAKEAIGEAMKLAPEDTKIKATQEDLNL